MLRAYKTKTIQGVKALYASNTTYVFSDNSTDIIEGYVYSSKGIQVWEITTFGKPRPSAIMVGYRVVNEEWLVTPKINITGFT